MDYFKSIAGYEEEKKTLSNLSNLFKKLDKFDEMGIQLPKGILLSGPNGVGKTVLAQAFIKNSGARCVTINTNEIENDKNYKDYIKSKFKEAAKELPCILFFDELDKFIGLQDQMFSDEVNNKTRFLLNEINKYNDKRGLFLLFVSNLKKLIDNSLIRSGRIDTVMKLNLPNYDERCEIAKLYLNKTKHDSSININDLANMFAGLSCADIQNIVNNAGIKALINDKGLITNADICSAMLDRTFNTSGKLIAKEKEDLVRLATHEAGHAAIYMIANQKSPNIASILSRNKSLGYVVGGDDTEVHTLEDIINDIKVFLAGYVAEKTFLGGTSTGCRMDLTNARVMVNELIRKDGYKGLSYLETLNKNSYDESGYEMSSEKLKEIEELEDELIEKLMFDVERHISSNRDLVNDIKEKLEVEKILYKNDLEKIFDSYFPKVNEEV